jgi:hypothetical protein
MLYQSFSQDVNSRNIPVRGDSRPIPVRAKTRPATDTLYRVIFITVVLMALLFEARTKRLTSLVNKPSVATFGVVQVRSGNSSTACFALQRSVAQRSKIVRVIRGEHRKEYGSRERSV